MMPFTKEDRTHTQRLSDAIDEAYERRRAGEPETER